MRALSEGRTNPTKRYIYIYSLLKSVLKILTFTRAKGQSYAKQDLVIDKAKFCPLGLEVFHVNAARRAAALFRRAEYKIHRTKTIEAIFNLNIYLLKKF